MGHIDWFRSQPRPRCLLQRLCRQYAACWLMMSSLGPGATTHAYCVAFKKCGASELCQCWCSWGSTRYTAWLCLLPSDAQPCLSPQAVVKLCQQSPTLVTSPIQSQQPWCWCCQMCGWPWLRSLGFLNPTRSSEPQPFPESCCTLVWSWRTDK